MAESNQLSWSFGLRNAEGNYLTVEAFGSRVNISGKSMKKKQIFFLERAPGEDEVFIRTWQGKYLSVDKDGNFSAGAEVPSEDEALKIEAQEDGKWCLVDRRAMYIHGTGDKMLALIRDRLPPGDTHKFTVHLAMHPQVCIRNVNRKRYLHLNTSDNTITCNEDIPWGDDAVLNLDFFEDGTYGIGTCQGTYLSHTGACVAKSNECKYMLEFHASQLAFKSMVTGSYLTCGGPNGMTKAQAQAAGKDELFVLEDSRPQIKMTSFKNLKVSIAGGIEVAANQKETSDTETFQIEAGAGGKWAVRGNNNKLWTCADNGSLRCEAEVTGANELFAIKWLDNKIALVASNGKLVKVEGNNVLKAVTELVADDQIPNECLFVYEITNRPRLVLRGEYGFIGSLASDLLESNKSMYETFSMSVKAGTCEIQGSNGKFWKVQEDRAKIFTTGDAKHALYLEFIDDSHVAVRYKDGAGTHYLKCEANGALTFQGTEVNQYTTWEF